MKLIATGDWQVAPNNLDRCEQMRDQLISECIRHHVDGVLHLGDVKQAFNPVDLRVTNFLANTITDLRNEHCFVFVVRGNHDNANANDTSQSILPVLAAAGAETAESPLDSFIAGGQVGIRAVPFLRSNEDIIAALDKPYGYPKHRVPKILLFHFEVAGSKWNTLATSKGQVTLEHLHPERYDLCLGGHIHYQQQLAPNVWYVGSPFCMDWGEANQEKGFLLIEVGRKVKVTRIASELPGWYDPSMPGFPNRKSWHGCNVRIQAPTSKDVSAAITTAHAAAIRKYVGCVPHVVPVYEEAAEEVEGVKGSSDDSLLRSYLKQRYPDERVGGMLAYLSSKIHGEFAFGIKGATPGRIVAKNVLCFKECTVDFDKPGITLITGKNKDWSGRANGVGKTSVLSLPAIAWFGESLKGQKTDKWRRDDADGPSLITSMATLPDGKTLEVVRGRSPGKFLLSVDGKDETMGDLHATQRRFQELTGLSLDVLKSAMYVGQHEVAALLHGTDKERKELFSRMLGLERFIKSQDLIRKDARNNDKMIDLCEQEAALARMALEEQQRAIPEVTALVPVKVENVVKLQRALKAAHTYGDEVRAQARALEQRYRCVRDAVVEANTQLQVFKKQLASIGASKRCPVCGSLIKNVAASSIHKKEMEREIAGLEQTIVDARKDQEKLESQLVKANKDLSDWVDTRDELNGRLRKAEQDTAFNARIAEADETQKKARKQAMRRVAYLKLAVARHEAARQAYVDTKEFLDRCFQAVSREGLPAYMCAKVCPQLNAAASRYASVFGDGEIQVQFHIEGGDLDLKIHNKHGGFGVDDQSMGESCIASFIAIFAFKEVLVPVPLLILDEPGEGLDAVNAANFAKGIHTVAERFGSVFITSHNPNIISNLDPDYHLEVVKHKRVSEIVRVR